MKDFLWWRDGVIYQIYPRSFSDSNHDGIGDLEGIRQRLDYLDDLGVDAIWLSPIYPSPDVDFGYDVSDYLSIDPKFGSMRDFGLLLKDAHRHGIHIILDLVLNHTSDQHPWFKESRESLDNPYRDYYIWHEPKPGRNPPNNWQSIFGGSGWELDHHTSQYYYHMFYKEQPDLNWRNHKVHRALLDVFRFWLDQGVDGFRLDVFNVFFKDSKLRNNPTKLFGLRPYERQEHIFDCDQPEMMHLLQEIRQILDAYPESYAVGETFLANPEKAGSYCGKNILHATFNFEFLRNSWNPKRFLNNVIQWEHVLRGKCWPNYVLNNHDTVRTSTRFGEGEDDQRLKVAAAMLLTMRGTPFLYYGEEIGMRNVRIKHSQIKDPIGKRYWPFYKGRDGCRAPMQWEAIPNAGFSTVEPWLPVHSDYIQRNVTNQYRDPHSILNFYKKLLALRKRHPVLVRGIFEPIQQKSKHVLVYERKYKNQRALIALNFSDSKIKIILVQSRKNKWRLLLSNQRKKLEILSADSFNLEGNEALILLNAF
ncbi:MAG TPA: alpha-glucosidase [Anaerolineae bacterium]|nr:alpha-glucosidase [Anaerolineae bacterium]